VTFPLPPENNDELVAVAWLGSIPGLSTQMVGTRLPADVVPDGQGGETPAPWLKTGFLTVTVVGGTDDPWLPVSKPVIQVDCWAAVPGSNKPPWWKAARLATAVKRATWDRDNIARPLHISVKGVTYPTAVVQSAYMTASFRRLYDDAGDYARYTGSLALTWVTPSETIP
jgi:hypothetical protein